MSDPNLCPLNSPLQNKYAKQSQGKFAKPPKCCVVTGGTGFVGQRLVEMLVERGAERVVSVDIVPPPEKHWKDPRIEYVIADITDRKAVFKFVADADCVWHNAAAVGPFHPHELYTKVNYQGTLNIIDACKHHKVPKIVMSSSPSTRFTGEDIDGLTEDELPEIPMPFYLQEYAASKAAGERALRDANCDELLTIAVAPHQVYGPRDNLFMPNMLEAAGTGRLRIFAAQRTGYGLNRVCYTHVDNYCHGLIIAENKLKKKSPVLGKFYIVTDGDTHPFTEGYAHFWETFDECVIGMGFPSLWSKFKLPLFLLMTIAYACNVFGWFTGMRLKLNPFNVTVLTMHRWFKITNAQNDLDFEPIIPWREGWTDAIEWFKENWLPPFLERQQGMFGIAAQSQRKIDIQAASGLKK